MSHTTTPIAITATVQSLDHSLVYLLSHNLPGHAVSLYCAHPQLRTPQLSLRLLHSLPYSPSAACPYAVFAERVLLGLHRSRHLQPSDVDELYKQLVCRGSVHLATLCFRLLCMDGVTPPSLASVTGDCSAPSSDGQLRPPRPPAATAQHKAAVYARLMLLQTYTTQRLLTEASVEVPVLVHAPITHTTLVLTAWCNTIQQQRQQQGAAGAGLEGAVLGEADVAMTESQWHPFLWQQYCRALDHRKASTASRSHQSTHTPLFFLSSGRPPPSSSSGPSSFDSTGVSLSDCLILAEHMRFLAFLRSSAVLSNAPRLLFLSAHLLLYHIVFLSSLCRDAALSAVLMDVQLFIYSTMLKQMKVQPTLLTINCVLSSWASHLKLTHNVGSSATDSAADSSTTALAGVDGSARHSYAAFSQLFTSCFPSFVSSSLAAAGASYTSPRRSKSSPGGEVKPNADSLLPFVSASTLHPSLAAPQLVAYAARTALALRQRKLAVSSPALLMMEQPLRHIEAMQSGRRADERSRAVTGGSAMDMDNASQAGEVSELSWDEAEWQRVRNRAKRGNQGSCAAIVTHYLRSLDRSAQWWSSSPYLDCSPTGRLPTFRLLFHCTAAVRDLPAVQSAWSHLLTLCPHPARPLLWLYLSALCHSHLRISRSSLHTSHPPPLAIGSFLSAFISLCHLHALPITSSCRSLVLHVLLSTYLSPTSASYAASSWKREVVGRMRTEALLVRDMANRWRPGEKERLERVRSRRRSVEGQRVDGEEWELSEYEREALMSYIKELYSVVEADEQLGVRGEWDKKGRIGGVLQLPALAMQTIKLPSFPIGETTGWCD